MQQNRVVLNLNVCHLHLPRTSGVDRQVGLLRLSRDSELISKHCRRTSAVTMKNVPIAVGFAVITASQLVLDIYLITCAAKRKSKARL